MRITEGRLRRIIREEASQLLREAAMNPQAAKHGGIYFEIKRRDDDIAINAYRGLAPWKKAGSSVPGSKKVGLLYASTGNNPCLSAWNVDLAKVDISGLGPLLYDLMIDVISPHPLMSDRAEVSDEARWVWDYYLERRPDIESFQLDDLKNTITKYTDVDNCEQSSAMIWSEDNYGVDDRWPKSSLSKAYMRRDGGTPVLDELQDFGLVSFI